MPTIFLSYRRTDSPEACRVYDWLGQRLGYDAIFMDVAAIPFAVQYPDFISKAIAQSKVLIALIGNEWEKRIDDGTDPVRMEIEAAIANQVPVLPVLIGNTPMPDADAMPKSISVIASQNADRVGVLLDFHSHMQMLLPKIESILGTLAMTSIGSSELLVHRACQSIIGYLKESALGNPHLAKWLRWTIIGVEGFDNPQDDRVTFYLHRVRRWTELIELHFILSFWARDPRLEQATVGCVMHQLEKSPIIPLEDMPSNLLPYDWTLKVRWSDEDPRQVWKMITDRPLRLTLAYVATVSRKNPIVSTDSAKGLDVISEPASQEFQSVKALDEKGAVD
jgi:hypothetical protein